jgi:hypothetical protein
VRLEASLAQRRVGLTQKKLEKAGKSWKKLDFVSQISRYYSKITPFSVYAR